MGSQGHTVLHERAFLISDFPCGALEVEGILLVEPWRRPHSWSPATGGRVSPGPAGSQAVRQSNRGAGFPYPYCIVGAKDVDSGAKLPEFIAQ